MTGAGKEEVVLDLQITMAAARVNAGKTQKDVAEEMRVSNKTVLNWETGKTRPKPAQLEMFCRICKISVDNIFLPDALT